MQARSLWRHANSGRTNMYTLHWSLSFAGHWKMLVHCWESFVWLNIQQSSELVDFWMTVLYLFTVYQPQRLRWCRCRYLSLSMFLITSHHYRLYNGSTDVYVTIVWQVLPITKYRSHGKTQLCRVFCDYLCLILTTAHPKRCYYTVFIVLFE